MEQYRAVYLGGTGEIVEKKSRFIANVASVKGEDEAIAYINAIKKQYHNASHYCFAYVIGTKAEIERCNDDGEPARTAGMPILEVIAGMGLRNVVVVVTRYFGGTLLGTGGLIRAYGAAAKEGIASSVIITKIPGHKLRIDLEYTELGKVQYLLAQRGVTTLHTEYADRVSIQAVLSQDICAEISKELKEETNGKVMPMVEEECWFAVVEGEVKIFHEEA